MYDEEKFEVRVMKRAEKDETADMSNLVGWKTDFNNEW